MMSAEEAQRYSGNCRDEHYKNDGFLRMMASDEPSP